MLKTFSGSGRRVFFAESVKTISSDILTRKTTSLQLQHGGNSPAAPRGARRVQALSRALGVLVRSWGLPGASRVPPASLRANMLTWRAPSPHNRPVVGISWTWVGARTRE